LLKAILSLNSEMAKRRG